MRELKFAATIVAATLLVGCNKDESTSTPAAPSGQSTPATPAPTTPANTPANAPKPPADAPTNPPPAQLPSSPVPAGGANDATKSEAVTKANELLQQGLQYVKDNKLELAEKTLTQLEGMKGQLPAEWGPKIEQLKSAIQAAKLGGGKLPGLGK